MVCLSVSLLPTLHHHMETWRQAVWSHVPSLPRTAHYQGLAPSWDRPQGLLGTSYLPAAWSCAQSLPKTGCLRQQAAGDLQQTHYKPITARTTKREPVLKTNKRSDNSGVGRSNSMIRPYKDKES